MMKPLTKILRLKLIRLALHNDKIMMMIFGNLCRQSALSFSAFIFKLQSILYFFKSDFDDQIFILSKSEY